MIITDMLYAYHWVLATLYAVLLMCSQDVAEASFVLLMPGERRVLLNLRLKPALGIGEVMMQGQFSTSSEGIGLRQLSQLI